eukprot:CAMPEP_0185034298 /NCGR_PEP_ID=MMETSP1103-20130426/24045_1 /TAXON_ID=36769 /ORGANISM="Paraphysomonas bandaiensis, Strain Caron Lab Isolate" /LENGTH=626 /DNA_ID=CAMNT_0027570905 /DNA_START=570 /DNA_END=2450 /DNA_ORIENTATION=+
MCGTSHEFTKDYKEEKDTTKRRRKEERKMKREISIPTEAQFNEASRHSMSPMRHSLSQEERQQAFNYRRLNQLTLRQKGARRRRMWQRTVDPETGIMSWTRVNFKEAMKSSHQQQSSSGSSVQRSSLFGMRRSHVSFSDASYSHRSRNSSFQDSAYSGEGIMRDSFDATMNSMSPGYSSYLNQSGDLQWDKIETGQRQAQNPPRANISAPSTSSYAGLMESMLPQDLQAVVAMSFNDKILWFMDMLSALQRPWTDGHIRIEVTRNNLLQDSYDQFMALSANGTELHRWMRIHFIGESGIDAGGLEREWFLLCTQALFESSTGLFTCSSGGDALAGTYHINPVSHLARSNHLGYYHFAGRLLSKAVMEQQTIPAMLSLPLRKQILGIPITFSDLEFVDVDLYRNLTWLRDIPEGVESLGLVFAVDYQYNGYSSTFELKPGGADIPVTDDNKQEFLELRLRHRMLDSIKPQLEMLLKGFYEVLPPELVAVFDYQELELLMCGLPTLDLDDWMRHTEYMGEFSRLGPRHRVIKWFWEVVASFSDEERVRLLQFTTGCSRLPAQGFKALQSNDGNFRKFNLQSIRKEDSAYPRAHTCFNKLDLPLYDSKRELEAYLSVVINMEVTGFTID